MGEWGEGTGGFRSRVPRYVYIESVFFVFGVNSAANLRGGSVDACGRLAAAVFLRLSLVGGVALARGCLVRRY